MNLDVEMIVDKSASMGTRDCPGGKSRWDYARESAVGLARYAEQHDPDGITVVPFSGTWKIHENTTSNKMDQVFSEHSPMGGTDTAGVLADRFAAYLERKGKGQAKPTLFFVLTDGEPNDKTAVAQVITQFTHKLDKDEEAAVQFVQVGNDPAAAAFLKQLDDDLVTAGAKFDVVDHTRLDDLEKFNFQELVVKSFTD